LVDDVVAKNVTNNGTPVGRDGFKALVRDLRGIAPDFKLTIDDVMVRGDRVIGHLTQRAGGATESRTILLRIDGGLVQEHWTWIAPPLVPYAVSLRAGGAQQPAASAN
jgi:predicted ester cyclase